MTDRGDQRSPATAAVVAVGPAFLQLAMLLGSWWPAAALAEALPDLTGTLGWRVTGLAPPLALWIGWRGTDAPRARRPRGWIYILQRGAVVAHLLFLASGFAALALGASPEVPWTWSVYSALGVAGALAEWQRAGRGLQGTRLSDPALLTAHFAARLYEELPDASISVDGLLRVSAQTADGRSTRAYLANLLREAERGPRNAIAAVERYVSSALEALENAGDGLEGGKREVVPIVRSRGLLDDCAELEIEPPVHDPLAGDLIIVYAFDLPRSIRQLQGTDLGLLEVAPEELGPLAASNLRRLLPRDQIERKPSAGRAACLWVAGGNYESSLLVLPELWQEEAAAVEGDLLACVPARDLLVTGDSADPTIRELMRRMWEDIAASGDHPISPTILKWTDDGWVADESGAT